MENLDMVTHAFHPLYSDCVYPCDIDGKQNDQTACKLSFEVASQRRSRKPSNAWVPFEA